MHAGPDAVAVHARFGRPFHADGPMAAAVRAALAARAAVLEAAAMPLHLAC